MTSRAKHIIITIAVITGLAILLIVALGNQGQKAAYTRCVAIAEAETGTTPDPAITDEAADPAGYASQAILNQQIAICKAEYGQ